MIIVKINAGLCNQIYRFATAYALSKEWEEELILDCDIDGNPEWIYLLDEFQIPSCKKIIYPLRYYTGKEYVKMPPEIRKNVQVVDEFYFEQDGEFLTVPKEKFKLKHPGKNIYLKGSFFKRQMFEKFLPEIRTFFTLKEPSSLVRNFEKKIKYETAVGVHIRKQGFRILGDDNGMDFFMAAIVYMRQRYKDARFYIFSDDLDYVKENLGSADDISYIDAMNGYRGDIEEFVCLTKCHHYILTRRSTYGRMAEILNPSEQKVSVLFGNNTWNDSEERFHFMSAEEIRVLSKLFIKRPISYGLHGVCLQRKEDSDLEKILNNISLNSEQVTPTNKKEMIFQKTGLYARQKKYGQAVHLCRLLEEQYGMDQADFHEYFGDLLYQYGAKREAVTEYIRASREKKISKDVFQSSEFSDYKKLLGKKKKHYVLVQYAAYTYQYVSEIQMLGLILARMGNAVSYIFKRATSEIPGEKVNAAMMEWNRNVDDTWMDLVMKKGFIFGKCSCGYPCYEYRSVCAHKKDFLQNTAAQHSDIETIFIGRDPEFIFADSSFRKVFVDFSAPFDEAYLEDEVEKTVINSMYECANLVVTMNRNYAKRGQKVIHINNDFITPHYENREISLPYYKPTLYTDDYLDIALKISLNLLS